MPAHVCPILALAIAITLSALAQEQPPATGQISPKEQGSTQQGPDSKAPERQHVHVHNMSQQMQMTANQTPETFADAIEQHATSGTSAEPNSTPVPMLMTMKGRWMVMFHGVAFFNVLQQSGPRGADKVFSTNWFMPMAQRRLGPGTFTVRTMLSLEPATITGRYYPELFQQGETAYRGAAS